MDKKVDLNQSSLSAYQQPSGINQYLQVNNFSISNKNFTVDDFEKIDKLSPDLKIFFLDMLKKEQDAALNDRSKLIAIESDNHKSYNARLTRAQWFSLLIVLSSISVVALLYFLNHEIIGTALMGAIVVIVAVMITGQVPQKIKTNDKSS
jgi:lipopolysaccharide export LptBFGC system permease protein LptF